MAQPLPPCTSRQGCPERAELRMFLHHRQATCLSACAAQRAWNAGGAASKLTHWTQQDAYRNAKHATLAHPGEVHSVLHKAWAWNWSQTEGSMNPGGLPAQPGLRGVVIGHEEGPRTAARSRAAIGARRRGVHAAPCGSSENGPPARRPPCRAAHTSCPEAPARGAVTSPQEVCELLMLPSVTRRALPPHPSEPGHVYI